MSEKRYIITESDLLNLLAASHELSCLEWSGVDNWWGYMDREQRVEYFHHQLDSVPEDDEEIEDMWFDTLAEQDLSRYEVYKEEV